MDEIPKKDFIRPPDEIPVKPTKVMKKARIHFDAKSFCEDIGLDVDADVIQLWTDMMKKEHRFAPIYFDDTHVKLQKPAKGRVVADVPLFDILFERLRDNYDILNCYIFLYGKVEDFDGKVDKETRKAYLMTQPRNFLLCVAQRDHFGEYSDTFSGATDEDSMEVIADKVMVHQGDVIRGVLSEVDKAEQGETEVEQPYSVPIPASMPDVLRCRIIKWREESGVEYCRASWLVGASVEKRDDHLVCMYALCAKMKFGAYRKFLTDRKDRNAPDDKWRFRLYVVDANEFSLFTTESLAPGESLQEERGLWGGVCMFVAHRAFLLATRGGWHRFRGGNHIRAILECANAVGEYMYPIVGDHEKVKAEFLRRKYNSKISVIRRALTTGFTPIKPLYSKTTFKVGKYFFAAPSTTPAEVVKGYAYYDLRRMKDTDGLSFKGNKTVVYVYLPRGMKTIPDDFFSGCKNLQMVHGVWSPQSLLYSDRRSDYTDTELDTVKKSLFGGE